MTRKPDTKLATPADLALAIGLLTRLPVGVDPARAEARGACAAWAWPLAGALTGLLAGLAGWIAAAIGAPVPVAAGLALTAQILLTGAMHEDGLADSADGLWGGSGVARRLEIMKDSRIGTYGVIALILSLGLRWAAMTVILSGGGLVVALLATGALSRVPMVAAMAALPNARGTGMAAAFGRPVQDTVFLAAAISLALGLICLGWALFPVLVWMLPAALAGAAIAKHRLGGQTGDILGAIQQLGEVAALASLAALAV